LIGGPLVALFSASRTIRGKALLAVARAATGAVRVGGSFELQLEAPNAANKPSTIKVETNLSGVQNFRSLITLFVILNSFYQT
jgi:hypothetical protein